MKERGWITRSVSDPPGFVVCFKLYPSCRGTFRNITTRHRHEFEPNHKIRNKSGSVEDRRKPAERVALRRAARGALSAISENVRALVAQKSRKQRTGAFRRQSEPTASDPRARILRLAQIQYRPLIADEPNRPDTGASARILFSEPPPACFKLNGLLGEIYELILGACRYPQPSFALAAAITVIAVSAGSRFRVASGTGPNLYSIIIGPSGCGKEEPVRCVKRILNLAGLGSRMVADNIASGAGLEDRVADSPACLVFIDEFGLLLGKTLTAPGADSGVFRTLTELYTKGGAPYCGRALAGRKPIQIPSPTLSVLASTTAEALFDAVSTAGAESGMLARFFFLPTNDPRPFRREPVIIRELPQSVLEGLSILSAEGPQVIVDIDDAAKKARDEFLDITDALLRLDNFESLVRAAHTRRGEVSIRLSIVSALGRNPARPIISEEDMEWAKELSKWSYGTAFRPFHYTQL